VTNDGFRVTETLEHTHPTHKKYPLLSGDLLVRELNGAYTKEAPGVCVMGFILTTEQEATLEPVQFNRNGLSYQILEDQ